MTLIKRSIRLCCCTSLLACADAAALRVDTARLMLSPRRLLVDRAVAPPRDLSISCCCKVGFIDIVFCTNECGNDNDVRCCGWCRELACIGGSDAIVRRRRKMPRADCILRRIRLTFMLLMLVFSIVEWQSQCRCCWSLTSGASDDVPMDGWWAPAPKNGSCSNGLWVGSKARKWKLGHNW